MTKASRPTLHPRKEGNLLFGQLDGCGGLQVRATSYPLTTRDPQGRQQADTPLRGCKVGLESNAPSADGFGRIYRELACAASSFAATGPSG